MTRTAWLFVVLVATGCVILVNYLSAERSESSGPKQSRFATATSVNIDSATLANIDSATSATNESPLPGTANNKEIPLPIAAETIDKLAAAAIGDDPRARAAAIDALANQPKSQALPVLQRVLSDGVEDDRQLALNSLRALALNQGDAEGDIRNVLRLTIYDGDNETIAAGAQVLLGDIERNTTSTQ
ncbi:MAG TPA: hypothetical protein VLC91_04615 [Spongiibacteraceae bacterium]|nr:hypothetical protein [Spongiibacteraceae bacterium]